MSGVTSVLSVFSSAPSRVAEKILAQTLQSTPEVAQRVLATYPVDPGSSFVSRRRIAKRLHRIARVRQQRSRRDLEAARAGVRQVQEQLLSMASDQEETEQALGEATTAADLQLLALGRMGYYAQRSRGRFLLEKAEEACEERSVRHSEALEAERTQERVWERVRDDWRREMVKIEQKDLDEIASQRHTRDSSELNEG